MFCKIGKIHKATFHDPSQCWNSKKFREFQQFRYLSSCTLPEGNAATCWWCFLHVGTEHLQNHATLQEFLEFLSKWKEPYNVLQSLWWLTENHKRFGHQHQIFRGVALRLFLNWNTVRFATPMQILEKRLLDRSSSSFRPCPKPSTAVGPCQVENQASKDST